LSDIPILEPVEFPALAGKPFRDTWATMTKHGKKKKPTTLATPTTVASTSMMNTNITTTVPPAQAMTSSPSQPKPQPKPPAIKPRTPDALHTTCYSIILNHSRPNICSLLGVDANRIFQNIRADLKQVNAPLTLLVGHWSSVTINKNFILKFAGIQNQDNIAKYDSIFFKLFGADCWGVLTAGYHTVLLCGVPLFRDDDGLLPSPHILDKEIGCNVVFKGILSLAPPHWLYNPLNIPEDRCTLLPNLYFNRLCMKAPQN
jgi:hypothetical protein